MKAGDNKEVAGETKMVAGSSSRFIILFYCGFIIIILDI